MPYPTSESSEIVFPIPNEIENRVMLFFKECKDCLYQMKEEYEKINYRIDKDVSNTFKTCFEKTEIWSTYQLQLKMKKVYLDLLWDEYLINQPAFITEESQNKYKSYKKLESCFHIQKERCLQSVQPSIITKDPEDLYLIS